MMARGALTVAPPEGHLELPPLLKWAYLPTSEDAADAASDPEPSDEGVKPVENDAKERLNESPEVDSRKDEWFEPWVTSEKSDVLPDMKDSPSSPLSETSVFQSQVWPHQLNLLIFPGQLQRLYKSKLSFIYEE